MLNALLSQTAAGQAAEAHRHAYNAAFEELGLTWYWDASTYARLQAHGREGVRIYLETEQSHLLRAYEAEFLVGAIETTQARCYASMGHRAVQAAYGWIGDSHLPPTSRHNATSGAPAHRAATSALT
ncbi:HAD family hydrolase [Polaromonas eurypsychrophila]|uniref:Uncharacterized protein n=1 Tax=Polaromonas eurypsychrophila TaxID=1614635 RepID=A0A916SID0_9BURK|nr:hypothetical protein [Polaromonas eurypsychrophila]GGB01675.1 hypothetical protein GCM10011496_23280 [Polaromonas eurypsychrophila]